MTQNLKCISGKRIFVFKHEIQAIVRDYRHRGKILYWYECQECLGYHLTKNSLHTDPETGITKVNTITGSHVVSVKQNNAQPITDPARLIPYACASLKDKRIRYVYYSPILTI